MKYLSLKLFAIMIATTPLFANASILRQLDPVVTDYMQGLDFKEAGNSEGRGYARGFVQTVDPIIPPSGGNTDACENTDFAAFTAGNIALIQRGACFFSIKVSNAINAGAIGVLIFNQGNTPTRTDSIVFNCQGACLIPTLSVSYDLGFSLIQQLQNGPVEIEMRVSTPATAMMLILSVAGLLGYSIRKR